MAAPIRWGILGTAKIAETALAPAIHAAEGAQLVALATNTPARAAPFTARYPGLRIVQGYDALLADPDIDAVYIPLPNHLHVEWTEKALRAGKHVLCEKPIALRAPEIDRLIAARNASGKLAAEGFMVVHHPQWHRAKELVAAGAIGTLVQVDGAFSFFNDDPANIRNRPETGGGGLYDIGVYPSVTTRFVTGQEPRRVQSWLRRENDVDTFAEVRAEFADFNLSFYVSTRLAPRQEMVFHGTEGWLRLAAPFNTRLYGDTRLDLRRADGTVTSERFNAVDQYQVMVEAFCRSVRTGAPFACPLEFSRGNQVMIDAALAGG